ncbi:hypothetical protein QBC45DRAFT_449856 [Copromyces sp. CBS 386.78]|nr:hypothetical protein QBC45DRAFT_449856 [Copromyces sp. CBS 386.78]
MTTFHPFPQLPWELRAQIWEMAIEPRNVFVVVAPSFIDPQLYKDHPKFELWGPRMYTRNTPAPAVRHVCQEARNYLQRQKIYEQAFIITPTVRLEECQDTPKFRAWHFDGDKIQRLQINIRTTRCESAYLLDAFLNLRELYINCCIGDVENRDYHYEGLDELVGAENVWQIPHPRLDPGIFKTTITLAKMRPELHEFWRREQEDRERGGEGYPSSTGQPLIETSAPGGGRLLGSFILKIIHDGALS